MAKDIRNIIKEFNEEPVELSVQHEKKFKNKLSRMHSTTKKNNFFFIKIAASFLLSIGVGYSVMRTIQNPEEIVKEKTHIKLSNISPEMQKVEDYYQAAINFELASLQPDNDNMGLIDSYLDKIGKLDEDYKRLNKKLSEEGIQTKTINELIINLQLRLQLLLQLKDQIEELQNAKQKSHEKNII